MSEYRKGKIDESSSFKDQTNELNRAMGALNGYDPTEKFMRTPLKQGVNLIETDQASTAEFEIQGRTLVNILGKSSSAEDFVLDETASAANWEMQSDGFLKVSNASRFRGVMPRNKPTVFPIGERYLFIYEHYGEGVQTSIPGQVTTHINTSSSTQLFCSIFTGDGIERIRNSLQVERFSLNDGDFFVKDFRLFKLSEEEYQTALSLNVEELNKRYPYVEGVQHLTNPVITKKGTNLLPPLYEWNFLHADAEVTGPYSMEINTTGTTNSYIEIPALPNTRYRAQLNQSGESNLHIQERTQPSGVVLRTNVVTPFPFGGSSFVTNERTRVLRINLQNNKGIPKLEVSDIMLYLQFDDANRLPFRPKNDDHIFIEASLASSYDGKTKDTLYRSNGEYLVRETMLKDVVFDGSENWTKRDTVNGFATFSLNVNDYPHYIKAVGRGDFYGQFTNGFVPSFVPSVAGYPTGIRDIIDKELLSMFGGSSIDNRLIYLGLSIDRLGGDTLTHFKTYLNSNPFIMSWELATPTERKVIFDGAMALHNGINLLEVDSGLMIQELVTPMLHTGNLNINAGTSNALLKNRPAEILEIRRNGVIDKRWRKFVRADSSSAIPTFGVGGAEIPNFKEEELDSNDVYTVTYIPMDKHKITTNLTNANVSYQTSMSAAMNKAVERLTDIEARESILARQIINLYARLTAGGS